MELDNLNTMEPKSVSPLKTALRIGFIIGLIFIVISLLTYVLDLQENAGIRYLDILVIIGGVIWAIKSHRDNDLNGFISYGRGLGVGTLSLFFASLLLAIYMFIYFYGIDPGAIDVMKQTARDKMIERGMSDSEIEEAMKYTTMFISPAIIAAGIVLWTTLIGFVVSLIGSAVMQRKSPGIS